MKKTIIICISIIALFTCACAVPDFGLTQDNNQNNPGDYPENAFNDDDEVLESENDNPAEDEYNYVFADIPTDEKIYDYYSSDGTFFIRQDLNTYSSYIKDNDRWIQVDIATGAYGPTIDKFDVDDDGEEEYLIAECEGSGTGFALYGLVIVKDDGKTSTTYKFDHEYFFNMIDESIDYNYNEKTHELEVHEQLPPNYDRYEGCSVNLNPDLTFEKIVYSDIIEISFEDDKMYMSAPIGCIYSEYMAPDYDNKILVKAELTLDEEMQIQPLIWTVSVEE